MRGVASRSHPRLPNHVCDVWLDSWACRLFCFRPFNIIRNTTQAIPLLVENTKYSTMQALMKLFTLTVTASVAVAFTPTPVSRVQSMPSSTQLYEDFGLGLGEPTYENQPDLLKGEQEYKQYVNRINEENMLNRKVRSRNDVPRANF